MIPPSTHQMSVGRGTHRETLAGVMPHHASTDNSSLSSFWMCFGISATMGLGSGSMMSTMSILMLYNFDLRLHRFPNW